jgi:hypothetical protein
MLFVAFMTMTAAAHWRLRLHVRVASSFFGGHRQVDQHWFVHFMYTRQKSTGNFDDIRSPVRFSKLFEEQKLNWLPDRIYGYHAITY